MRHFEDEAAQMGDLIAVGLSHGMLHGNQNVTQRMIDSLAGQATMKGIHILNKKGEVKLSSNKALVGRHFDIQDKTCQLCHSVMPNVSSKSAVFDSEGERVFRSVTSIINKEECHSCHRSGQRLNGVLIVDYSMQPFAVEVRKNLAMMSVAILLTIAGSAGSIWILFDRLIMKRLLKFLKMVRKISLGDLNSQITVADEDEISELERSFNIMSQSLQKSITEVKSTRDSLEKLINSIEDEIMVIDRKFRILDLNDAALRRIGVKRERAVGRLCYEVCYGLSRPCAEADKECPVCETFSSGFSHSSCHSLVVDGEMRDFEQHTSPMRNGDGTVEKVIKISRDVSQRKRLENQLAQSERLIALGQLSAEVAHQVNNPVGVIVNRIDCLKREGKLEQLPESVRADLNVMMECAWRVSNIARGLLSFSRESDLLIEQVNVNEAIRMAVDMVQMQRGVDRKISIEVDLQPDLPIINGDSNKLEQCLVNILNNAIDATPDAGVVKLTGMLDCEGEQRIVIRISDRGAGIAAKDLPKIFDPFFTTKAVGEGTGLGLSISYGIVKEHNGTLRVSSILGQGTTFTISLPISNGGQET